MLKIVLTPPNLGPLGISLFSLMVNLRLNTLLRGVQVFAFSLPGKRFARLPPSVTLLVARRTSTNHGTQLWRRNFDKIAHHLSEAWWNEWWLHAVVTAFAQWFNICSSKFGGTEPFTPKSRGGARGCQGRATAPPKFCLPPPKIRSLSVGLFLKVLHRPLTAPLVAKLAPPVAPPNENVWLRPCPRVYAPGNID